jgi:DNA-binding IclR family transcriptional regulator
MKQDKDKKSIYKVQALERALDILDCFSFQDRELSLTDVVHRTGLNKTTVKRLISNLTTRGYLHQDPPSKKYQLGMRLFELGGIVFSSFSLRQAASYPMTRLQNEADATVLLGVNMEDQLVYVDKREGKGIIRVSSEVGWRRPLNYGMLGMVLMSSLDPQDVKRVLKKYPLKPYTPLSITDADAFSLRLGQIRDQGYVIEKEEATRTMIWTSSSTWLKMPAKRFRPIWDISKSNRSGFKVQRFRGSKSRVQRSPFRVQRSKNQSL